jgi:hypothetical protein
MTSGKKCQQFRSTNPRALLVAAVPAIVDLNIADDRPAQPVETFLKNCQNGALNPEHCVLSLCFQALGEPT